MTGLQIGYIRVSSFDQRPERQLDGIALDQPFIDHASGKDVDRPQLATLLTFVRRGDTVVVRCKAGPHAVCACNFSKKT
jgi:DNA invertase Pin-like site-specific DNA recombinase